MKSICKTFLGMGVTFRDESNEPSSIMIGYSDATVTALNHPPIVRSKASLAEQLLQYHSCGGNFIIRLYLISLISGQSIRLLRPGDDDGSSRSDLTGRPGRH